MCRYWKKLHTCGDLSDRPYIEMCRPGCLSNIVCIDIGTDETPRKSHFPCYQCIKNEARREIEDRLKAEFAEHQTAQKARNNAVREKQVAEQKLKEERVRREAREKAMREREEEAKIKAEKEREDERVKKEGGAWVETGSGKKSKGRKNMGMAFGFPVLPSSAPPTVKTFAEREKQSGANRGARMSPKNETKTPEASGRAGVWGPTPTKILSRKENMVMKK
ncbi:hypothetical protein DE146DRAFT_615250 [Phaeosphaeria sp. MPI-PUGE-AT-0046c]|nr:hypothetical protein DE146DRAFT_615250 [Phaeosphaeria sp. MPI-PUGE-AT-0046c]